MPCLHSPDFVAIRGAWIRVDRVLIMIRENQFAKAAKAPVFTTQFSIEALSSLTLFAPKATGPRARRISDLITDLLAPECPRKIRIKIWVHG